MLRLFRWLEENQDYLSYWPWLDGNRKLKTELKSPFLPLLSATCNTDVAETLHEFQKDLATLCKRAFSEWLWLCGGYGYGYGWMAWLCCIQWVILLQNVACILLVPCIVILVMILSWNWFLQLIMPEQWCSKCIILPSQLTWHFLTVTGDSIGTLANAKAAVSCRFLCACAMTDCYLNFPPCRRVGRERR